MKKNVNTSMPAKSGKGLTIGITLAAIVTAIGIILWIVQLSGGLIQTGMRNLDNWGLYMAMFMFFVGLSAGGLILSSVPKAFGMAGFGGISKVAVWTSICATVAAIAFVVVDLGQPLRVWELFVYSNLVSPLMWDVLVLFTYLILSIIYLWVQTRAEQGKVSALALRAVSVVALVCAVLVHSVTAWIFGLQASHEMWHTALLGPWFVSSALVCGTGLVLAVCIALRKTGYLVFEDKNITKLAKMLGAFILVDLYFFGCDLLTAGYPQAEGAKVVEMLVSGPLAPFFWGEIVCCVIAAVICFVPSLRKPSTVAAAGLLAIPGIFFKRVQIIVGGFQIANLTYAGPVTSHTITNWEGTIAQAYEGIVYVPTSIEFGVALGVIGLAAMLLFIGLKYLPLKPAQD